jgi:integral membrane sensor domain MASE1
MAWRGEEMSIFIIGSAPLLCCFSSSYSHVNIQKYRRSASWAAVRILLLSALDISLSHPFYFIYFILVFFAWMSQRLHAWGALEGGKYYFKSVNRHSALPPSIAVLTLFIL